MICVKTILNSYKLRQNLSKSMSFSTNSIIKTIEFKTCGPLYQKLKKINPNLYGNSPSEGLTVNVEYADSFGDNINKSDDIKTIVAIHGNPGNHKHFNDLINSFAAKESTVRVIAPNMPDFGITRKTMAFWHSNQERSQFIRDFLNAINVQTVDCLVSHSAGIHPISLIWAEPRGLTVKSIAIFAPQYVSDYFFKINWFFSMFSTNKLGIALMDRIKPHKLLEGRSPMTYSSVDEVLYFCLVHSYLNNSKFNEFLDILKSKRMPTLLAYGETDKLIPKQMYEKFVEKLGADTTDSVIYSNDKHMEKDSEGNNWLKIAILRGGGHFCYAKYNEEVTKELLKHCLQIRSNL